MPSSRVGDGFPDCCDGADESGAAAARAPGCGEDAVAAYRAGAAARAELFGDASVCVGTAIRVGGRGAAYEVFSVHVIAATARQPKTRGFTQAPMDAALAETCIDLLERPFTYRVCFGSTVEQRENSETRSLGTLYRHDAVSRTWHYVGGDPCGDTPRRAIVTAACGVATEIKSVDEPEMCSYALRVATPAACDDAWAATLPATAADGGPKIVAGWLQTHGEAGEVLWYHTGTAAVSAEVPEGWS